MMDATGPQSPPLWEQFCQELAAARDAGELSALRTRYLGRKRGLISQELKKLGTLDPSQRPQAGQRINRLKQQVEEALRERLLQLERESTAEDLARRVDVTLPGYVPAPAHPHPLRRVWSEMEEIAVRMGFTVCSGPEVESDYYNFEALNIPRGHPARDDQDTLFITENQLLRTHTSPVQIRTMERFQPPLRIVVPGRVYRRDTFDATHSPVFHQLEGLVVDQGISLADLKGTLEVFLRALFSAETRVRLRPSYFPFVEPGAEVDISCIFCGGEGCRVCKRNGWIEIMGAGMVHPRVFEMVGYDPEKYTGFAWGMGIDRIAILKWQVNDIRLFFENDLRFLSQF